MIKLHKFKRVAAAAAIVFGTVLVSSNEATAAPKTEHCVIVVIGVDENNNFITEPMTCYKTVAEAQAAVSVGIVSASIKASLGGGVVIALIPAGHIAVHYDGFNGTGSSLSIVGSSCSGGGLNLPGSWNDRISSTESNCGFNRHWEHINYTGGDEYTGSGLKNLGPLNNKTSSVIYS